MTTRRAAHRTTLACLALSAAMTVQAEARAAAFVVVLWTRTDDQDERVLERVRGQTSDLDITLLDARDLRAPSLGAQLDGASGIARQRGAQAVVWFEPLAEAGAGILVLVADPRGGRILVRRIDAGHRAGGVTLRELDSATLEAAALVVRTALRGLAEGAVIGLEQAEVTRAAPPPPAPPPEVPPEPLPVPPVPVIPVMPVMPVPPLPVPPQPPPSGWTAAVGWQAAYDGQALQNGLAARVGYAYDHWHAGLLAAPTLGAELSGQYARAHLEHHAFGAFGDFTFAGSRSLSAAAGLAAGAILFRRTTDAVLAGASPAAPAWNPAAFVGAEATLRWFPGALGGRLGFWLVGGADAVPGAPTLGYEAGGRFVAAWALWKVQPRGALGLSVETF